MIDVHASVMAVKLSMASGAAPSNPTFSKARAIVRRSPLLAESSLVGAEEAWGKAPVFPTERMVYGVCTRCRLVSAPPFSPSRAASALRFRESVDIVLGASLGFDGAARET